MVKMMAWEDATGKHMLPYMEPRELYNTPLKLTRYFEVDLNGQHNTVLEVRTQTDGVTMYVLLTGVRAERVVEALKWDGKKPIDFRIVRREYTLLREGEADGGEES